VSVIHANTHTHIHTGQMANKRSHSVLPFSHGLQMHYFCCWFEQGRGPGGNGWDPGFPAYRLHQSGCQD